MSATLSQILGESGGGLIGDGPSATSNNPNQIHVIVRGQDSVPYLRHFDGSAWGPYTSLGGLVDGQPAIVSRSPGTLDVFIRGVDGALWTRWFDGSGWSDWISLGGYLSTPPAAVSRAPGTIDVFVGGADGALWTRRLDGSSWSGWGYLGGLVSATPAAASPRHGDITEFVRGRDARCGPSTTGAVPGRNGCRWVAQSPRRQPPRPGVAARSTCSLAELTVPCGPSGTTAPRGVRGPLSADRSRVPPRQPPNSSTVAVFARGQDAALWNRWMTGGWERGEASAARSRDFPTMHQGSA